MSLIKFRGPTVPARFDSFFPEDDFFSDILDTRRGIFNLNRIFNGDPLKSYAFSPAVNIKDSDANFEIELAAPGLAKDDFKVTIENGMLNISAEKETKKEEEKEGFLRKEFSYNSFSRSMSLPESVDESKDVKANYKDGILHLDLPKKKELKAKAKQIKIA
ncbi:Hsp20/alpha crystallin family protein [Gillisia sp. M10.2A]|uniref:Hsp20/alpha crystallin family protein n=1 Tax=Gillisia lutea TaxID=2909668 RepID=A0ABS9ELG4_9FLAO|nr:Hsp20/alpha crystallin family protein [Gillisia lutea]MCF4102719.1 Hsp20/alpha crystallin family protein [Gillisia lutea]